MPFGIADVVYGFVAPAAIACVLLLVFRRRFAGRSAQAFVTTTAFVIGFQAGYWLLSWRLALAPLRPSAHWHWLPEAVALTWVAAATGLVKSGRFRIWPVTVLLASVASAWVVVPDWATLEPSRAVHIVMFVAIVLPTTFLLEPLTGRYATPAFPAVLTGVFLSGAIVLVLSGSLRFAQMAGCGVAALLGLTVAVWLSKREQPLEGIAFPVTLVLSALMLIGRVNSFSEVPMISYVLLPLAPLTLWVEAKTRRPDDSRWRRSLLLSLPLLVCGVAVVLAALPEFAQSAGS
jgi:hypothetical protein